MLKNGDNTNPSKPAYRRGNFKPIFRRKPGPISSKPGADTSGNKSGLASIDLSTDATDEDGKLLDGNTGNASGFDTDRERGTSGNDGRNNEPARDARGDISIAGNGAERTSANRGKPGRKPKPSRIRVDLFSQTKNSGKTQSSQAPIPRLIDVKEVEELSAKENDFDFICKFVQGIFSIPAALFGEHWNVNKDEGIQVKNAVVDYIASLDKTNSKWLKEFLDKHGALIVLCITLSSILIPRVVQSVNLTKNTQASNKNIRLVKPVGEPKQNPIIPAVKPDNNINAGGGVNPNQGCIAGSGFANILEQDLANNPYKPN